MPPAAQRTLKLSVPNVCGISRNNLRRIRWPDIGTQHESVLLNGHDDRVRLGKLHANDCSLVSTKQDVIGGSRAEIRDDRKLVAERMVAAIGGNAWKQRQSSAAGEDGPSARNVCQIARRSTRNVRDSDTATTPRVPPRARHWVPRDVGRATRVGFRCIVAASSRRSRVCISRA